MRNRFDQLMKQALCALLLRAGTVETDAEVSPETQRIDLWFHHDPARAGALAGLGLLGRLVSRPCAIEAFHTTPRPTELDACHRKHMNFCHQLSTRAPSLPPPRQWVLSSGRPVSGLKGFGCRRARGWPRGIYVAPPRLRLGIVVIRELPVEAETLILRLFGAGSTLKQAIAELKALPPEALERRVMLPILVRLRFEVPADQEQQTSEDREFLMSTQDAMEIWERQLRDEGLRKGMDEGLRKGMERGLTAARHSLLLIYETRFGTVPLAVRARMEATSDLDTLMRWTERVARDAREDIDRELGAAV